MKVSNSTATYSFTPMIKISTSNMFPIRNWLYSWHHKLPVWKAVFNKMPPGLCCVCYTRTRTDKTCFQRKWLLLTMCGNCVYCWLIPLSLYLLAWQTCWYSVFNSWWHFGWTVQERRKMADLLSKAIGGLGGGALNSLTNGIFNLW